MIQPLNKTDMGNVEVGKVITLKDGIVTIVGLRTVKAGELVFVSRSKNTTGEGLYIKALVLNLNVENINAILLGNEKLTAEGATVYRSNNLLKINTGLRLFGRVCNSLGDFKDDLLLGISVSEDENYIERASLVEKKATGIVDRVSVSIPLRTGTKAVDSLVPIGRGQRELIIGDRQTGKTSVAIDAILNHVFINNIIKGRGKELTLGDLRNITWFVYASIGQKQSTVSENIKKLVNHNAFWYTSVVAATAAEPAPLQFLAPYTACAVGEFIRDIVGGHCVVIYDDLSKHAIAYRQMSLLLRRPPGREAFPGDVFYVHSRLLERAGSLNNKMVTVKDVDSGTMVEFEQVRGTLTAFPIIETQAGDVSAYIPTNVISITDGQIFLETELFYKGIRPAINVGLSVSRVGSAAQPAIMKRVSGSLKIELAQFREIEGFAKLGANLDEHTQRLLIRGENIIEVLKQDVNDPMTTFEQTLSIFLGIGYSPAWLNEVLKSKWVYEDHMLSFTRARMSWLETLRLKTADFKISDIKPFIASLLSFSDAIGFRDMMGSNIVEDLTNSMITKCPYLFFDDIVILYMFDTGIIDRVENEVSVLDNFYIVSKADMTISPYNVVGTGNENTSIMHIKDETHDCIACEFYKYGQFIMFCNEELQINIASPISARVMRLDEFSDKLLSDFCLASN